MIPGEIVYGDGDIAINPGAQRLTMNVVNTGDRPVQVGSHVHLPQANGALDFDRMKKDAKDDEAPRFAKLKLEGMTGDDEMFTALQPFGVPNVPFDVALD